MGKVFGISLAHTRVAGNRPDASRSQERGTRPDLWKARSGWKEEQQCYSQGVSYLPWPKTLAELYRARQQ